MGLSLCTLAEVKAYAGISSTNQDTQLTAIIPQVSSFVKQYCNRDFIDWVNDDKVEVFNGGDPYYYLRESPTIIVSSLELSTDYGQNYTALTEFVDYILDVQHDRLQVLSIPVDYPFHAPRSRVNDTPVFPFYQNGYRATYNAGFAELPQDVKLGTLELIMYYLKSDTAVKSSGNIGRNNAVIEYITNGKLPSSIARLLDYWVQDYP